MNTLNPDFFTYQEAWRAISRLTGDPLAMPCRQVDDRDRYAVGDCILVRWFDPPATRDRVAWVRFDGPSRAQFVDLPLPEPTDVQSPK
jgi:hypothetical protein